MALYNYEAYSRDGKKMSGSQEAASTHAVREALTKQGFYPTKVVPAQGGIFSVGGLFERSISIQDKLFFTKQLSTLLKAGVPLADALSLLITQSQGRLKRIVSAMRDDLTEGRSFGDALSRHSDVFENIYIQLVRAGEAGGNLEQVLDQLESYIERQQELQKAVRGALRYPMIQLSVIIVVAILMVVFIVPRIVNSLAGEGDLPLPTRFLMGIAYFFGSHYLILIVFAIAGYIGFRFWKRTRQGARAIDQIKLKLPLVKYFVKMRGVVQFSQTLGMLLRNGVNLSDALDIVSKIIDNRVLLDTLEEAREKIVKQGKVAQYLEKTDMFPPVAIYLIRTGEESGELDTMLLTVAEQYEADLKEYADSLTSKINPAMLIVMALLVGFIMVSVFMPVISYVQEVM
jgi:type II secretory pathway component PulF